MGSIRSRARVLIAATVLAVFGTASATAAAPQLTPEVVFEGKAIPYEDRFQYADYCSYDGDGPIECFVAPPGGIQYMSQAQQLLLADCNGDNSRWVRNYEHSNRRGEYI